MKNEKLEELRNHLYEAVIQNETESILFSGGIDSSVLAYESMKKNKDIMAVTVGVDKVRKTDFEYSTAVAKAIHLKNHKLVLMDPQELKDIVYDVVKYLKNFSIEWIAASITLYVGCRYIKRNQITSVISGEGSDDLFASFPCFMNWKKSEEELNTVLNERLKDIDIMTNEMAKGLGIRCITPFYNERLKEFALSLPYSERIHVEGDKKISKYALRRAYMGILPQLCLERPQTMSFEGSGTYGLLNDLSTGISDKEFEAYSKEYFQFRNKLELYLFQLYDEIHGYKKSEDKKACLYCHSNMGRKESVHCTVCGTLQYQGEIIPF